MRPRFTGILQFCSLFELEYRSFGQLNVAAEMVRVENGLDVPKAVARERCKDACQDRPCEIGSCHANS
jgi:hypothetical protein